MFKLFMASLLPYLIPAIIFQNSQELPYLHIVKLNKKKIIILQTGEISAGKILIWLNF
jgi:hypothetical protein